MGLTSEEIKKIRMSFDMSINEFGLLVGVSGRTVKYWEDGEKDASPKHVRKIKQLVNANSSSKVHSDSIETLLLRIQNLILNLEAREKTNSEFIKRIYQLASSKGKNEVSSEFNSLLSRFLSGELKDQQLIDIE